MPQPVLSTIGDVELRLRLIVRLINVVIRPKQVIFISPRVRVWVSQLRPLSQLSIARLGDATVPVSVTQPISQPIVFAFPLVSVSTFPLIFSFAPPIARALASLVLRQWLFLVLLWWLLTAFGLLRLLRLLSRWILKPQLNQPPLEPPLQALGQVWPSPYLFA